MKRREFLALVGSFTAIALIHPAGPLVDLETIYYAKRLGDALENSFKGEMRIFKTMGRVGVTFSAEQQAQIKAMVEAGQIVNAQRAVLAELDKEQRGIAPA